MFIRTQNIQSLNNLVHLAIRNRETDSTASDFYARNRRKTFQSRNRETFDSNGHPFSVCQPTHLLHQFQSRNRETYDSNMYLQNERGSNV